MRVGSEDYWDKAEAALKAAADASGLEVELNEGDGAFYGPKLDFVLRDAIGREWQAGTIQLDPNTPERLKASYVGDDDKKHAPVMLHRASPVQVVIATITSEADGYAEEVADKMRARGLRVETDTRNEKINYKIRELSADRKIPVIAVVGKREAEEGTLALRRLGTQKQAFLPLDEVLEALSHEAMPPDMKRGALDS